MCHLLGVSRSSYYEWLLSKPTVRKRNDEQLKEQIKEIFLMNYGNYGTRRIKRALARNGIVVSRRRIGWLMKKMQLACKSRRKYKMTTDSNHNLPIFPNLLGRDFSPKQINRYYAGDITYIHTAEGWLYLAVVIDLYSRRIVGWAMDKKMKASLVNAALLMAIWRRKPAKGLIWHTDRGSQYASNSHREICKAHGIRQSMSRKADCWDNAVAESFFHSLKVELVHSVQFNTREEAKTAVFEYIEVYYNRLRMHSANDYLSPVEYEVACRAA